MTFFRKSLSLLGSRALTVWLFSLFILYYLSIAVWSKEAFGTFTANLAQKSLFKAAYSLFFVNVALRSIQALKTYWPDRKRFYLRLPLLAGVVLFLAAFFMSLNVRQTTWLIVGEGDRVSLPWESSSFLIEKVESALEKRALVQQDSKVFQFEPVITVGTAEGKSYRIGAFPAVGVGSSYLHILNFGIGPNVEIRKNGRVFSRAEYALRIVPFGDTDFFEVPGLPYKFYLTIVPNRVIKKGRETARDYDMSKPRYQIAVLKGDKTIAKGEADDQFAFDGSMTMIFHAPADWVFLEAVYDPFRLPFLIALLLVSLGLVFFIISMIIPMIRIFNS